MHRFTPLLPAFALIVAACASTPEKAAPDPHSTGFTVNPPKLDPRPTSSEITARDLMTRLYIFADDSMQGRRTGTEGYARGAAYIVSELERIGAQPAGEDGYLQHVPFGVRRLNVQQPLTLGNNTFALGTDVRLGVTAWTPRDFGGGLVIYGGGAPDRLSPTLLNRTVVIALPGDRTLVEAAPDGPLGRASMVLYVTDGETPAPLGRILADSVVGYFSTGINDGPMVGTITRSAAERMFGRPLANVNPGTEIAGVPLNGMVLHETEQLPAYNIIAVVPGSDPALRGQYVGLGAHADHIGIRPGGPVDHDSLRAINAMEWQMRGAYPGGPRLTIEERQSLRVNVDSLRAIRAPRPDSINNGADDDGSGSMGLLEIAEYVASLPEKPRRSVLFVWHAGEEQGLRGANHFVNNPTVPLDSIVSVINIDMIGRGGAEDVSIGGPDYLALVGSRRLSTQLGDVIDRLNEAQPRPLVFDYRLDADGHPENLYCRSDHFHYARVGIPVAFFFTGLHGDYHQVTDEPQYIDYGRYSRIVNFTSLVVRSLANSELRPTVDKPIPDPNLPCRQ